MLGELRKALHCKCQWRRVSIKILNMNAKTLVLKFPQNSNSVSREMKVCRPIPDQHYNQYMVFIGENK